MYYTPYANVLVQEMGAARSHYDPSIVQNCPPLPVDFVPAQLPITMVSGQSPLMVDFIRWARIYEDRLIPIPWPTVLMIASYNSALFRQRQRLTAAGFNVKAAHSLLDGYTQTLQLLALPKPAPPAVVLLDIHSVQPGFPELTGSLLAAVLTQHMQFREIHPAWLIGLSEYSDAQDETEALVAGCHQVLPAPLGDEIIPKLQELALRPVLIPHLDAWPDQVRILRMMQRMAARVLQVVRDAYIESWTPDDLSQVLSWITRYPVARPKSGGVTAKTLSFQTIYPERLVRSLGGARAAHVRLRMIADQWQQRYPLHGQILHKFLDGYERREIVRHFVGQGLYEDTRIYTCIKELPDRLSEQFRLDQVAAGIA